jgi:catechol 2,3-dioxygenase-like lactoylglutathione lyase family enzyme
MTGHMRSIVIAPLVLVSSLFAQQDTQRPHILGIAHVGIYVNDLDRTRTFYKDFLGFGEPFSLKREDGTEWIVYIKINELQYIELFAERHRSGGPLGHFALYTDNLAHMKDYLESRGVEPVDNIHAGRTGNRFFTIKDPDGHTVEIMQYEPGSWTSETRGNFLPSGRVSARILHVGLRARSTEATERFYRDVLGFRVFTDPVSFPKQRGWVTLRVPDGDDYVELIPYEPSRWAESQTLQDHFCLAVSDAKKVVADLQLRGKDESAQSASVAREIDVEVGDHEEWEVSMFDPSGTRIELREPPKPDRKQDPAAATSPPLRGAPKR